MEFVKLLPFFFLIIDVSTDLTISNNSSINESVEITTKIVVKDFKDKRIKNKCPPFDEDVELTQSELLGRLTKSCRYDKIQRPHRFDTNGKSLPVEVYVRSFVFYMQNLDTHNLQFTLQMRFQIRYNDDRLEFSKVGSNQTEPIIGEKDVSDQLWKPHIFFVNEKSASTLGIENRDVITAIHSNGTVIISSRIQETLYCSMKFKNFPFDQQHCKLTIGNWIYNSSQVKLHWEPIKPFTIGSDKILTEYTYMNTVTNESEINASQVGLQYGDFTGNYSTLIFVMNLDRSIGYYLLDYYFPSIMLVAISWLSFWLQADQAAPRAMLGTTAMLTFITLSSNQTKALPKVSYIKFSEVWFIVCAMFIFASLIEFAFVNLLWRRKKIVMVEEVTTANILKETLTPMLSRKSFDADSGSLRRVKSDTSLDRYNREDLTFKNNNFELNLRPPNQTSNQLSVPTINRDVVDSNKTNDIIIPVPTTTEESTPKKKKKFTALTHQEIAILLDKEARWVFPCAFLVFNIVYWTLVNI
ncbi:pH-sensitive chloride channel 2-like [Chironomus tepperi]|uniref:pH-sensitive chloride channel 2-like n=1 Tax=Chironomus tepperi TaxID=113505 RepID=UPI00391F6AB4